MHAAKGLEFPTVIIAGLEEGLFPHSRSAESVEELEEERRLCYVGITRAESHLILTSAARRRVFGEYQSTEPSRSSTEIPAELIDRIQPTYLVVVPSGQLRPQHYEFRTNPYGRTPRGKVREEEPAYGCEVREPGRRRRPPRHARPPSAVRRRQRQSRIEEQNDDFKVTVRFNSVGVKKLLAKYRQARTGVESRPAV